jgi:hypothetical protein
VENNTIFITQSTFQNNEGILHVLKKWEIEQTPKYTYKIKTQRLQFNVCAIEINK